MGTDADRASHAVRFRMTCPPDERHPDHIADPAAGWALTHLPDEDAVMFEAPGVTVRLTGAGIRMAVVRLEITDPRGG